MPNLKPFIWGVVVGAIALPVLGFTAFNWRFDSKAQAMARDATNAAMKKTLVPVCVAQFRTDPDAGTHLATLKAKKHSHQQTEYVGLGGWATLPGYDAPSSGLANDCARKLVAKVP